MINRNQFNKERVVLIALILTGSYFFIEIVGGIVTESLALMSDALHMLTDVTSLTIAYIATKIEIKLADDKRTFGYQRVEILAAALNTFLLFAVGLYILYEAYVRISEPPQIESLGMFVIALIGLVINMISMGLLAPGKNFDLNLKTAYLEVWSDALCSVGVIGGALLIYFFHWVWIDSLIGVLIGLWILPRAWVLFKISMNILLEGVPDGLDIAQIRRSMIAIEGIFDVHDLHVWGISSHTIILTAHLVVESNASHEELISVLNQLLKTKFNITHTTLQFEHEKFNCR